MPWGKFQCNNYRKILWLPITSHQLLGLEAPCWPRSKHPTTLTTYNFTSTEIHLPHCSVLIKTLRLSQWQSFTRSIPPSSQQHGKSDNDVLYCLLAKCWNPTPAQVMTTTSLLLATRAPPMEHGNPTMELDFNHLVFT